MVLLKKLRSLGFFLIEIFESLLVIPILLCILIISLMVSLPRLWPTLTEFVELMRANSLETFEISKINILVLPVLSFLALAILKHVNKTDKGLREIKSDFDSSARTLINSVRGVEFIEFADEKDLKAYLNKITDAAKREVADLTWAHRRPESLPTGPKRTEADQTAWEKLESEHAEIVRRVSQTRRYREVVILSRRDRIEKIRRRMRDNAPKYFCCVLEEAAIPRLQFVVVDEAEAVFVSDNHKVLCSIKHPSLVKLLMGYFEDAWKMGRQLVAFENNKAVWNRDLATQVLEEASDKIGLTQGDGPLATMADIWIRPGKTF